MGDVMLVSLEHVCLYNVVVFHFTSSRVCLENCVFSIIGSLKQFKRGQLTCWFPSPSVLIPNLLLLGSVGVFFSKFRPLNA